jgi:cyanate permease
MSVPFVALAVLGSLCTLAGIVAGVLLPPAEGGVNWWYLVPGVALGALLDLAAVFVLMNSRKQK